MQKNLPKNFQKKIIKFNLDGVENFGVIYY